MSPLWKIYLGVLLVTTAEGGMNIIYPPFLQKSNYSIVEIGLLVALFGVLQLVSRLPVGALYGAAHAKSLYGAALAVYALSTIGFAYPGGRAFVYLLTMLHGFAFGGVGTVTLAWAIELSRAHSPRGAAMGWYTAALSGGYSIGNFLSGLMVDHWGYVVAGSCARGRDGRSFTRLDWVRRQFRDKLGFDPYPGTLNLQIDAKVDAVWIVPQVPGCREDVVELIAAVSLREALHLQDGDAVWIQRVEGEE